MEKSPESRGRNEHYSVQRGHQERGIMNRAIAEASTQTDVISRGQLYIERRIHMPRYTSDGRK